MKNQNEAESNIAGVGCLGAVIIGVVIASLAMQLGASESLAGGLGFAAIIVGWPLVIMAVTWAEHTK